MILAMFKRFLGRNNTISNAEAPARTPEFIVSEIQRGDLQLRNQFIVDYQPYIAKTTSQFCKKYIDPSRDDEYSIALSAFNEAIDHFSQSGGKSFLGFAETVIRRRLIDYLRKEERHRGNIPFSSFESEDEEQNIINPIEVMQAVEAYDVQQAAEERQSEILDLNRCLLEFDIRFTDLVQASPKHSDSRLLLMKVGVMLASDSELMRKLITKKLLPVGELTVKTELSRKTIERNRKYIIAIALIHNGPYPYLREYMHIGKSTEMSVSP